MPTHFAQCPRRSDDHELLDLVPEDLMVEPLRCGGCVSILVDLMACRVSGTGVATSSAGLVALVQIRRDQGREFGARFITRVAVKLEMLPINQRDNGAMWSLHQYLLTHRRSGQT
jgi:hypothetical protein